MLWGVWRGLGAAWVGVRRGAVPHVVRSPRPTLAAAQRKNRAGREPMRRCKQA